MGPSYELMMLGEVQAVVRIRLPWVSGTTKRCRFHDTLLLIALIGDRLCWIVVHCQPADDHSGTELAQKTKVL